ncbi:efflux RND transporter periplasmic adaptor subunit [Pseudoalteromonas sp. SG45-1]|jgi:multidrug efflux pump subunit AcrA (membrane-fusion protein)|uniref:efflux RND transporter periplasmic adaptor subunit n=1 Tax=Pseudoalteromonas sp. SG45-1 TaxID=2760957 RepID=UPI0015FF83A6|nr:HlyD family efflux transporter periplasmic adaptor subunit [Pseudoalteromonas sp. SG45-1]MBB1403002.1 HlyD family efflux transporter periplasmic adaptor subunit [Pseudoalteromonas sp. SG45-1]
MEEYLIVKQKSRYPIAIAALLLLLALGYLIKILLFSNDIPERYLKPILVSQVSLPNVLKGIGTIEPTQRELLSAPLKGNINTLTIREGQAIKKGQVLAKLTNYELEQDIHNASYEQLNLESQVAIDKSNLAIKLSQIKVDLSKAKMALQQQALELNANKVLMEQGIISAIRFKQSEMLYKQSELEVNAKNGELSLFKEAFDQQLIALDNKVNISKNKLSYLQRRQEQLTLTANFDGTVSQSLAKLGQAVTQGQSLFELIETDNLLAKIQVPQYSSTQLKIGQKADIVTPSGTIAAKVDYIDTVIRNGAINVFLVLDASPPSWLRSSQAIEAHIYLEQSLVAQNIKKPNDFDNYSLWKVYEITPSSKAILTHINYKTTEQDTLSFDESLQGNYVLLLPAAYATQSYLDLKEVF